MFHLQNKLKKWIKHEKSNGDKQPIKKMPIVIVNAIFNFLGPRSFQKNNMHQKKVFGELGSSYY
jgi:hypothetical protein